MTFATTDLTETEQRWARTLERWRDDPFSYYEEALFCRDFVTQEFVPLVAKPAQRRLIEALQEARRVRAADKLNVRPIEFCVPKARKLGQSTIITAEMHRHAYFMPTAQSLLVCQDDKSSVNMMETVRDFHVHFAHDYEDGESYRIPLTVDQKRTGHMEWAHGARAHVMTAGSDVAPRSWTFTFILASEFAHWPKPEDIMLSLAGSFAPIVVIFYESTANGMGDAFHEMWIRANLPPTDAKWNGVHPLFLPWYLEPTYRRRPYPGEAVTLSYEEATMLERFSLTVDQVLWYREKLNGTHIQGDRLRMQQEYPSTAEEAFVASGSNVFFAPSVNTLIETAGRARPAYHAAVQDEENPNIVTFAERDYGRLAVWGEPQTWRDRLEVEHPAEYIVGVDVGGGTDNDYSVASVWRRVNEARMEQVAEFRDNRSEVIPTRFAAVVDALIERYTVMGQEPLIVPECDPFGRTVIQMLVRHYRRWNFYRREVSPEILKSETDEVFRIGYFPSSEAKKQLVEPLRAAVQRLDAVVHSRFLLDEMLTYSARHDKGRTVYRPVKSTGHDDCIIAAALAWLGHGQLAPVKTGPPPEKVGRTRAEAYEASIHEAIKEKKARAQKPHERLHDATLGYIGGRRKRPIR